MYISIPESPFKQVMLVLGETALLLTIYNFMSHHSRFNAEGVAEASLIFLRDAHILPKWLSYE
jgi:hypothetical protein